MLIEEFYRLMMRTIQSQQVETENHALKESKLKNLFCQLEAIYGECAEDSSLRMIKMTILLEGFYQHLCENTSLKKDFLHLRMNRWINHYGTPTVHFLLTYENEINKINYYFENFSNANGEFLWNNFCLPTQVILDDVNNILVNPHITQKVETPENKEIPGQFTKTHNPHGGFAASPTDEYSQAFITAAKKGGKICEIAAGFGGASLESLDKNLREEKTAISFFCNDISPRNLAVIQNRFMKQNNMNPMEENINKLTLIPGAFFEELNGLPTDFFDVVFVCRLLHFFSGNKIEEALKHILKWLKPGGKLIVVCETNLLKNWEKFIPEYENRIELGWEWPGEITNPADYETSGRAAVLPTFVHWIRKEILEKVLIRTGYEIERISYINRRGQFPADLLFAEEDPRSGKESVGAIAVKPI